MANICNTKFLGITLDNTLIWKTHVDTITPTLSLTYMVIRAGRPLLSQELLMMVYYWYFHSVMMYAIIFGGTPTIARQFLGCKKKKLLESLRGLEIEMLVGNISGNKYITVTIQIYTITFILCDLQHKLL
jgi:hypothetical protein